MFWNLQINKVFSQHYGREVLKVPDTECDWRLLTETDLETIRKEIAETDTKLNLILDHLKLKYVPETEKKEPAKLVEQTASSTIDFFEKWVLPYADKELAKSKRKYTKRKKSNK